MDWTPRIAQLAGPYGGVVDAVLARAVEDPERLAIEFSDGQEVVDSVTLGELAGRVTSFAGALIDQSSPDSSRPVLVLLPAGIDYVVAVLGCMLAGHPVVPLYPQDYPVAAGDRLPAVIADSGAEVAVAASDAAPVTGLRMLHVPPSGPGPTWKASPRDGIAVLQYTSGSTGRPRGVKVSHRSLIANVASIAGRFELDDSSRAVSWLPPFHDMGLVGGILTPLTTGVPVRLLAPETFLLAPMTWLRAVQDFGADVSGGPDFAYDLCVRRAKSAAALEDLDLSGWRVAFNGAERVQAATMRRFAEKFAPAGFEAGAFFPCYGLAEATLMVTADRVPASLFTETEGHDELVSCGTPVPAVDLRVVDRDASPACEVSPGAEGELWVAGECVTDGYWSGGDDELFGDLDGRRYLRTGDLGRLGASGLVITGRTKDLIVHRGVNYHAEDVEQAARAVLGTRLGAAAAFQIEDHLGSRSVLVAEVRDRRTPADLADDEVVGVARAAVLERCGLVLDEVLTVEPRSVPRTSSGKVRRGETRTLFADKLDRCVPTGFDDLTQLLCGVLSEVLGLEDIEPDQSYFALGVDSLKAAEAAGVTAEALGVEIPLRVMRQGQTVEESATALWRYWRETGEADDVAVRLTGLLHTSTKAPA